ncbi:MmcQ/YjbR family DNA-binding protein [Streptomyces oceani]|uniref:Cytoplasmic protein n=1 Tax=Streptomyces oceani TaxID=1075402 RepID=A0A1E7KFI1_9ACTN|nr:MmcQ/YjbR family DNA-binding protein [Streptomyces oceani]OEV02681.1 cytoplasmic protein [Streptomyces oceani]
MDGESLQEVAQRHAESLPSAWLARPFGPDREVLKVRGKVFMLMTSVPGKPVVILKSEPGEAEALRATHTDITRGYHMNKRHWTTLEAGGSIDEKLVEELVTESYRLVVGNFPRSDQPVDPETYGTPARASRG